VPGHGPRLHLGHLWASWVQARYFPCGSITKKMEQGLARGELSRDILGGRLMVTMTTVEPGIAITSIIGQSTYLASPCVIEWHP
jgi:hypothetical protein